MDVLKCNRHLKNEKDHWKMLSTFEIVLDIEKNLNLSKFEVVLDFISVDAICLLDASLKVQNLTLQTDTQITVFADLC